MNEPPTVEVTKISHRRWLIEVVVLLCVVLESSCSGSGAAGPTLKAGDPGYPAVNPNPLQVVQLTVVVPPSLSADFEVQYEIPWVFVFDEQGAVRRIESPAGCPLQQSDGATIHLPLRLQKDGDTYRGRFVVDAFEPGACKWQFGKVVSSLVRNPLVSHNESRTGRQADFRLDAWCTRQHRYTSLRDPDHPNRPDQIYNCLPLLIVESVGRSLPAGFVRSIPEYQRPWKGGTDIADIGPGAKSITVEFHDLDVLIPAFIAYQQRNPH